MDAIAYPKPPVRRLRVYAFDPRHRPKLDTAGFNEATIELPWEERVQARAGRRIPRGGRLRSRRAARSMGRSTSTTRTFWPRTGWRRRKANPRFHQQMVYAVAMTTIRPSSARSAARCCGRRAGQQAKGPTSSVPKLRCYPHALREANAYYSPDKKALLFGYFPASAPARGATCRAGCSPACRTTSSPTRPRTPSWTGCTGATSSRRARRLAFHEAFADIVALFPHFTPARSGAPSDRADPRQPRRQNLLGDLAQQFGQAHRHARRAAQRDRRQVDGQSPIRRLLERTLEPHDRGAILVAAVFDAFLAIYKARVADLLRLVYGGRRSRTARPASGPAEPHGARGDQGGRPTCCGCASARSTTARRWTSVRRLPARPDHRRPGPGPGRRPGLPDRDDRGVSPPRHLSLRLPLARDRQPALAVAPKVAFPNRGHA